MSKTEDLLATRYGGARRGRRVAVGAVVTILAAAFLAWVAWAVWIHTTPQATSELLGWTVVDDHALEARVAVHVDEGAQARCVVRALAEDHTPVGDYSWVPTSGTNTVTIRTERRATAVDLVGCTTPDQQSPR
ncbi:MAG: DUF4307 domain-containing protein [Nocardioides sp.]|uniref:DUF4307 domain-containing protein n=1 Tax=Nocardioides sp. TaxID=35761 RepID=UPI0039E4FABC